MTLFSLIKKGTVLPPSDTKVIPADAFCELIEAKKLIEDAKIEAVELLKKTDIECKELKAEAKEAGKDEGLVEFNKHLLFFSKKMKQFEVELQKLVLPIALRAAKKVVAGELKLRPEIIVDIVMKTLKPITQNKTIRILVSKEDRPIIEAKRKELKQILDHVQILAIEEREDIESGGCIIETETGIINATLENQWRALEAAFETFKP